MIRSFNLFILLFVVINWTVAGNTTLTKSTNHRERHVINCDWKFLRADIQNAALQSFDDKDWDDINLPHSFSIPYFMHKFVYNGYGWYRKHLNVPASWLGRHVEIEFEGVFIEVEIYVNGLKVGAHIGGYTGFSLDITPFIKEGDNTLAIRVNNLWRADVAPRAGDHQFSGGIYRDVYLTITDPLHIDWYGTFFTSSNITPSLATVKAVTTVRNDGDSKRKISLRTDIFAPNGSKVASAISQKAILKPRQVLDVEQKIKVNDPALWSTDHPNLYIAETTVVCDKKAIDTYRTTFGIRSMKWAANEGFELNGKKLYLRGVNVHQDRAGWGDAATNAAFVRDVKMMKDAGFNFIRGCHYPHDPAFVHACDSIGVIYLSENAFWGMGGGGGDTNGWGTPSSSAYPPQATDQSRFEDSVLQQLKEMIRIHRNSPSIAAWSLCNEVFFSDRTVIPKVRALLNRATDSVYVWDASRQVGIGGCQRQGFDKLGKGQVAFYNGDGARFPNPNVPNMVSEYGSRSMWRPGTFSPGWGDVAHANNVDGESPQWRSGQAIWCGFDHGTIGGLGLGTMGIVDYFRLPKRPYYWYKACYGGGENKPREPHWPQHGIPAKLLLSADKTSISAPDGTDDVMLTVTICGEDNLPINNCVPITLTVLTGPGEFPTGRAITFLPPDENNEQADIFIRDGQCAIDFRSYHAGTSIIEASSPGLPPTRISIITKGSPAWEEGKTKPVVNRPYHRYKVENEKGARSMTLAQNRPSSVSSHPEQRIAINDENIATAWIPDVNDAERWCIIDLEATYCLSDVELLFPAKKEYRFVVEASADGSSWQEIGSYAKNTTLIDKTSISTEGHSPVRFVRIAFLSDESGIAEIRIGGVAY